MICRRVSEQIPGVCVEVGGALGLPLVATTPFAPDDMTVDLVETAPRETSPEPGETNTSQA